MLTGTTISAFAPGRGAVITGAASGIGLATARQLAAFGMRVCIADRDRTTIEKAMQDVASLARNGADDVLAVEADVSSPDDIERLAENTFGRFGDIALLMNNAAAFQGSDALSDPDGWRRILDVNVLALIRNKLGGEVVSDPVIEGLGCGVGGEAQDLAARDSSKACCAIDNEEAQ